MSQGFLGTRGTRGTRGTCGTRGGTPELVLCRDVWRARELYDGPLQSNRGALEHRGGSEWGAGLVQG